MSRSPGTDDLVKKMGMQPEIFGAIEGHVHVLPEPQLSSRTSAVLAAPTRSISFHSATTFGDISRQAAAVKFDEQSELLTARVDIANADVQCASSVPHDISEFALYDAPYGR